MVRITNQTTMEKSTINAGRILRTALLALPFGFLFYLQLEESVRIDVGRSLRIEKDVVLAVSQQGIKSRQNKQRQQQQQQQQVESSLSRRVPPKYETTTLLISYYQVTVRYPARAFDRLNNNNHIDSRHNNRLVVTGVLSMAENVQQRDIIRSTWAFARPNVFFVVSGEWTAALKEETERYQDVVWVDDEEDYRRITWKSLVWFRIARRWLGNVRFVLKTDDDAYVNLAALETHLLDETSSSSASPVNYLGYCMHGQSPRHRQMLEEEYPTYASGAGYLISHSFLTCLDDLSDRWLAVVDEDANTGILARECRVSCQHDDRILPWRDLNGSFYLDGKDGKGSAWWIHHYVKASEEMTYIHAKVCEGEHADPVSCGIGSDQTIPDELPLYCDYRLVDSCGECVEEDPRERKATEVCSGSCYICPFATKEPTRCIPKSQECTPPKGFVPPPPPPDWYDNEEDEDGATPPARRSGRSDGSRD